MMPSRSLVAAGVLFAACATSSRQATVSIRNLACLDCADELEQRAQQQPGVRAAHFDPSRVEMKLELAPEASLDGIVAAIAKDPIDGMKIEAIVGAGQGAFTPFTSFEPGWDAQVLAPHGEDVTLQPVGGKVTIVDFSAEWCGPCHVLDQRVHELIAARPQRIAYRRLNVVDWDSPLAKHYLGGAGELPYVIVYDVRGKEAARIAGLKWEELKSAIEKAEQ